ncbi:uncharacterized protein LOC124149944 [Haliotis rufescens]|uniref:uncharacterized protein LOC124149944 n=1 Tax=Haliotis rufescens TaxID=6454 RepID=UPI00201F0533|nr:uncharacterized protein LOC124149944 [Haliotis rufescens]
MTMLLLLTTVVAAALVASVANGMCLPYVELETTTTFSYQSLHKQGVDLAPGATSFKFKVRAANDAHVALLQDDGVTNQNLYEVVIGGWNNTRSAIRAGVQHNSRVEARHTPLSADQFRDFWISWGNGVISVGSGMEVGVGKFMNWTDPSPHAIKYIAVSTGWGSTGLWRFSPSSVVPLATNTVYKYQSLHDLGVNLAPDATSFTFKVRAENDAFVALLQEDGVTNQNIYEVLIGGWHNTRSVIRTGKQFNSRVEARHTPLSSTQFRDFWISWEDGVISVGAGKVVGVEMFMTWTDPTPHPVNYIAVSTGWGSTGLWEFYGSPPVVCLSTANDYRYHSVDDLGVHLNGRTSFTFWVKATNDALIALLRNKNDYDQDIYEIVIGGWENSKSVIREKKQGPILAHVDHVPLSGNKHLPFWISFSDGTIAVGAGTEVGTRQFMSWKDPTPTQIGYVGVATGWGATGQWLFPKNMA